MVRGAKDSMGYFSGIFLAVVVLFHGAVEAQERGNCLRFGSISAKIHQQLSVQIASHLTKNGVCVDILYAPQKRLTALLLNKDLDGEFLRTPAYERQIKSVAFMVHPAIMSAKGVLVVENPAYRTQADIQEKNIGYVRGTNWVMDHVSASTRLIAVSQLSQLPEMVRKGRIDGFFINEVSWQDLAPRYPTLRAIEVSDLSAHIWLRHEYADIGERISNIVKQLDLKALSQ